jgi:hypothetical protein
LYYYLFDLPKISYRITAIELATMGIHSSHKPQLGHLMSLSIS